MDILKQELKKKRKALADEVVGRKLFKRALQDRAEAPPEVRLQSMQHCHSSSTANTTTTTTSAAAVSSSLNSLSSRSKSNPDSSTKILTVATNKNKIDDLNLPKPEVIRCFHLLNQPVTLFSEDDDAHLNHFKLVLKAGTFEVDKDMTEGQTNDFLRDIVELNKRQKSGMLSEGKRKSQDLEDGDGGVVLVMRI